MGSAYRPPRWLRNPHVQSVLSSMPLRRAAGLRELRRLGAETTEHIITVEDGVRLQGFHSQLPKSDAPSRGLVLLLHGWEGSSESSYMRHTAAQLLARGFEVFRLNFRDHGDTHHLNEGMFHSNRIDEVVPRPGIAHARPHTAQTVFYGKSLVTGRFVLLSPGLDGLAFGADAVVFRFTFGRFGGCLLAVGLRTRSYRLRHGRGRQPPGKQGNRHRDEASGDHVSPVSTVRRSSARNSLDCISLSRDIVRGNSCAKGPAV